MITRSSTLNSEACTYVGTGGRQTVSFTIPLLDGRLFEHGVYRVVCCVGLYSVHGVHTWHHQLQGTFV